MQHVLHEVSREDAWRNYVGFFRDYRFFERSSVIDVYKCLCTSRQDLLLEYRQMRKDLFEAIDGYGLRIVYVDEIAPVRAPRFLNEINPGAQYLHEERTILCRNDLKKSAYLFLHEFAHALDIDLRDGNLHKFSPSNTELIASAATYLFNSQKFQHYCTLLDFFVGYAIEWGAKYEDLEEVREQVFLVANKIQEFFE